MTEALTAAVPQESRRAARLTRAAAACLILLAALVAISILSLALGVTQIAADQVIAILFGGGERVARIVVMEVRLPRLVMGILCGSALAAAGAMLQDALKNPLAEPSLLGVSSGASLVVAMVVVFNLALPAQSLPVFALIGGLLAGSVILVTTRLTRDPVRMILIGAGLSALFSAALTVIMVLGEPDEIRILYRFLAGSLIGADWQAARVVAVWVMGALPASLLLARPLNLLQLGDDMAEGLGLPVFRTRTLILIIAILLQAPVIAVCGPIGFVSLIAPHMVRAVLQTNDSRMVLPTSMLTGAVLLSLADLVARQVLMPAELPVGLITIMVGSPIALILLRRVMGRTNR